MLLKEYNEVLEEGIKYFKNSKRIEKLVDKIGKKINLLTKPEEKRDVAKVMIALQEIAEEFKMFETEKMNKKNKYQLMKQYYTLEEKYSDIIKMVNKETVLNAIKKISGAALFSAIFFVGYDFFFQSGASANIIKGASIGEKTGGEVVVDTVNKLADEGARNRMKTGAEFQRGIAQTFAKHGEKFGEEGEQLASQSEMYLQSEKAISGILSGAGAASSTLLFKLFTKLFGAGRKTVLYTKSKMILEKLGKL